MPRSRRIEPKHSKDPTVRRRRFGRPDTGVVPVTPVSSSSLLSHIEDMAVRAKVEAAWNKYTAEESKNQHPNLTENSGYTKTYTAQCLTAFLNLKQADANKDEVFRIFREQSRTYCDRTCNRSYKETIVRNLWTILSRPGFALLGLHGLKTLSESDSFLGIAPGVVVLPYMLAITGGVSLISCFYYLYKKNYEALLNSLTTAFMALTVGLSLLIPIPVPITMILVTIYICTKLLVSLYGIYNKQNASHVANPSMIANPLQKASAELSNALIDAVQAEAKVKTSSVSKSKREKEEQGVEMRSLRRGMQPGDSHAETPDSTSNSLKNRLSSQKRTPLTPGVDRDESHLVSPANSRVDRSRLFGSPRTAMSREGHPSNAKAPALNLNFDTDDDD